MSKIIWLASYPKSGNTWMRAFLHNLFRDPEEAYDINKITDFSTSDSSIDWYTAQDKRDWTEWSALDVARMRRFYGDTLGCSVEKVQAEIGLTQLRAGRSLIDLVDIAGKPGRMGGAPPGAEGRNMDHLCLRVERLDDPAIAAHLQASGIEPGEIVSRYGAEGEGPSMYITDPEGNTVELKGPPTVRR